MSLDPDTEATEPQAALDPEAQGADPVDADLGDATTSKGSGFSDPDHSL